MHMERKAQASTEYLVILAVVIVVAVVVAGLMGNFISFGGQTSDRQSKLSWENAEIGLLDWVMSSDGQDVLVVRNNIGYDIFINNITVEGVSQSVNTSVSVGEKRTIKSDWASCEQDSSYSYSVSFDYTNVEFELDKTFTGVEMIIGTCQ